MGPCGVGANRYHAMFCDFCACDDCLGGKTYEFYAQAPDGRWCCLTCWLYDMCTSMGGGRGPCDDDYFCEHRFVPITPWLNFTDRIAFDENTR